MNEIKQYYYENINTFNKVSRNIPKWYWISIVLVSIIYFFVAKKFDNMIFNIIFCILSGGLGGVLLIYLHYKELKSIAISNDIKVENRGISIKYVRELLNELRNKEKYAVKQLLKKYKIYKLDKLQHIVGILREELQEKESKHNNSIIIAIVVPLLIDIVISFYSLHNLSLTIDQYIIAIFSSLIMHALPFILFILLIANAFNIITKREKKKEQLRDLIYIIDEIIIFK